MVTDSSNDALALARQLADRTGANIFLTGKAGTGKTTFLRRLVQESHKRIVVAAPTGIAAINARGVTLHSLFQLEFGPFLPGSRKKVEKFNRRKLALIRSMDMLVIDEISMVRSDLLDYVDDVLRRVRNRFKPFGGVQLLLIGDLQQLPPVVKENEWDLLRERYASPYFFHSHALKEAGYVTLELDKVYRQEDARFIAMLNALRSGKYLDRALTLLNERYRPDFEPPASENWINLTTHNARAASINDAKLAELKTTEFTYEAVVTDDFPEALYPAEKTLRLRKGAQVMFVKNDPSAGKEYYNGMIGRVSALDEENVQVDTAEGETVTVSRVLWENTAYSIDPKTGEMEETTKGTYAQIPLRTAWAITIHKSQGLTFDRAVIDASASFAHGQAYVALSRCRNLEGLVLSAPLRPQSIITDRTVSDFLEAGRLSIPDGSTVRRLETEYVATLLDELFLPEKLLQFFHDYHRAAEEAFRSNFPRLMERYSATARELDALSQVGKSFSLQYRNLMATGDEPLAESPVQARIKAAIGYFMPRYKGLVALLADTPEEHDNAQTQKRLQMHRAGLDSELALITALLAHLEENPLDTTEYLNRRARIIVSIENPQAHKTQKAAPPKARKTRSASEAIELEDAKDSPLFIALQEWRKEKAKARGVPAYTIFSTKALLGIASVAPANYQELLACPGVGPKLAARYGTEVLDIVEQTT